MDLFIVSIEGDLVSLLVDIHVDVDVDVRVVVS
jgi:hypothetical protein